MRQYISNNVEVTWQGLDFKDGLAVGTYITPARTTPSYTQKAQVNGKVIRSYNADESGTLTLLINQSSALHRELITLAKADMLTHQIVGPMVIKEAATGDQTTYKNAYIQTIPDISFSMEDADISWLFGFESVEYIEGGLNENIVGS